MGDVIHLYQDNGLDCIYRWTETPMFVTKSSNAAPLILQSRLSFVTDSVTHSSVLVTSPGISCFQNHPLPQTRSIFVIAQHDLLIRSTAPSDAAS